VLRFSGTYVRYALLKKMFGGLKLSPLGYISTKGPDTTYTKVSIVALRPFHHNSNKLGDRPDNNINW
jgi:hypothetical protein